MTVGEVTNTHIQRYLRGMTVTPQSVPLALGSIQHDKEGLVQSKGTRFSPQPFLLGRLQFYLLFRTIDILAMGILKGLLPGSIRKQTACSVYCPDSTQLTANIRARWEGSYPGDLPRWSLVLLVGLQYTTKSDSSMAMDWFLSQYFMLFSCGDEHDIALSQHPHHVTLWLP